MGIVAMAWVSRLLFTGTDLMMMLGSLDTPAVLVYGFVYRPLAEPCLAQGGAGTDAGLLGVTFPERP